MVLVIQILSIVITTQKFASMG
ncbi:unnamed protein product, partial [Rotaria sordida]